MRIGRTFCAALIFCISTVSAQAYYQIDNDPGGSMDAYADHYQRLYASRQQVIVNGPCRSACTMLLGILPPEQVCTTKRGSFGFHAARELVEIPEEPNRELMGVHPPYGRKKIEISGSRKKMFLRASKEGTRELMRYYPPYVKEMISKRGGLRARMFFIRGSDLVQRCSYK